MTKDVRLTIRIPEQLKEKVQKMASDLNISVNDAIKVMIDAYKRN